MDQLDRRTEFKDDEWQQGALLDTHTTRRFTETERKISHGIESRRAFVNFRSSDEGRGRTLVFCYDSPEECAAAVKRHNRWLKVKRFVKDLLWVLGDMEQAAMRAKRKKR